MTTDITELALLVSKAKASVFTLEYISQFEPADIDSDDVDLRFEVDGRDTGTNVSIVDECGQAAKVIGTLVEALEKAQAGEKQWREVVDAFCSDDADWHKLTNSNNELIALLSQALCKQADRIAELESRTATATAAAADVLAERKRQVTTEGWTPEHDDQHVNFEMAIAGGLYAISAVDSHHKLRNSAPSAWPWDRKWWKPDGPRRDLVKAGALILAEIERLDRAAGIKVEAE
ncbi:TPA: hypothetical protein ACN760_002021 [Klebsiella pneumoniae]